MLIERMGEKWRAKSEARFALFRDARALYLETMRVELFAQKNAYEWTEGDFAEARADQRLAQSESLYLESLALCRSENAWHDAAVTCFQLGMLYHMQGRFAEAEASLAEGLEIGDSLPALDESDVELISGCCYHLGIMASRKGQTEAAKEMLERSKRLDESLGDLAAAALTRNALEHVTGEKADTAESVNGDEF